jgi:uncharacterized membrane protein YeiB
MKFKNRALTLFAVLFGLAIQVVMAGGVPISGSGGLP